MTPAYTVETVNRSYSYKNTGLITDQEKYVSFFRTRQVNLNQLHSNETHLVLKKDTSLLFFLISNRPISYPNL